MFRRGFKTWAEQTSARVRQKLNLSLCSPLDPMQLAEILGVIVLSPDDLGELNEDVRSRLLNDHGDNWSAITVTDGRSHLIVANSSHAHTRRNSNLAHELAHIILGHEPSMMFMSPNSGLALRTYNEDQEQEADWLAGCLLLPRDALLTIRRRRLADGEICAEYGVSPAMLRFRLNITGIDVQLRRARGRRS
jgi:Zn-dependent peptidase ImmA (M78 family)